MLEFTRKAALNEARHLHPRTAARRCCANSWPASCGRRGVEPGAIEICISDNASEDGTAQIVAEFQRQSRFPISYHRFPTDMRGVRNFNNAVEMARAEYCWLVGSDDILLDGGVR